ncbi:MAG: DUF5652 family protein [Candidatus Paceibacterota bacterium]|jgi:hypothetical protein
MNFNFLNLQNYFGPDFVTNYAWLISLIFIWSIIWKGLALWKAAGRKEKWWFIVLLIVNTIGILEILYLFVFSKDKKQV